MATRRRAKVRFEGRELKEHAEPVLPDQLQEGKVYFAVIFLDEQSMAPSMEPRGFIGALPELEGKKLDCSRLGLLPAWDPLRVTNADEEATFVTGAVRHILEYERALDALMACALGGEKGRTTKRAASATPEVGDTSRTLDASR